MSAYCSISRFILTCAFCLLSACGREDTAEGAGQGEATLPKPCTPDNGGLTLPPGFCAGIVADSLGFVRHLAISSRGDIYATLRNNRLNLGGILALRDTDDDARIDQIEKFSETPGMGIQISGDNLYFASDTGIYLYRLQGQLVPPLPPEIIVHDLPVQELHAAKPFAMDDAGHLYINFGATTNACQSGPDHSPGQQPCQELDQHAGIWRFARDQLNQTQADGYHYARGIRNAYAIDWHPEYRKLYVVQHGRDQLYEQWPEFYDAEAGARLPAEEFFAVEENADYGWPYCYYDPVQNMRILAPEYGGDGKTAGRCADIEPPLIGFPAHYSPNDLKFYTGQQFPVRYHNGAFIAFHGSYNRGDYDQVGYQVVFVPFMNALPAGAWEVFADGFAGTEAVHAPEDAEHRPTGIATGPDGSLYIADSVQGRIWRVLYTGNDAAEVRATR